MRKLFTKLNKYKKNFDNANKILSNSIDCIKYAPFERMSLPRIWQCINPFNIGLPSPDNSAMGLKAIVCGTSPFRGVKSAVQAVSNRATHEGRESFGTKFPRFTGILSHKIRFGEVDKIKKSPFPPAFTLAGATHVANFADIGEERSAHVKRAMHVGRGNFGTKFLRFTGILSHKIRFGEVDKSKKSSFSPAFTLAGVTHVNNFGDIDAKCTAHVGRATHVNNFADIGKKCAFTLAEVLITITIVGVVSVMLLGTVRKIQDIQFRNAYKKAYADINQALRLSLANGEIVKRTSQYQINATNEEFAFIKNAFKTSKVCAKTKLNDCWASGDLVCKSPCGNGFPKSGSSDSFIDIQGRAWAQYTEGENIFLVDINGTKRPNRFGKDRFLFTFGNTKGNRVNDASLYTTVVPPFSDSTSSNWTCYNPPCYYRSWLK